MKRPVGPLLVLAIGSLGWASLLLGAEQGGRGQPMEILRAGGVILTAEEEAQDAREIAAMINEAINLHREVIITLHNDTSINVAGPVTARRSWLIIPLPDRSEIRFRAAMIASVKFK